MFFVQAKGPQTKTSNGIERWHTLEECKTLAIAEKQLKFWSETLPTNYELKIEKSESK